MRFQKAQATMEMALILPFVAGLMALAIQGGLILSDNISISHYAYDAALWSQANKSTATTGSSGTIAKHIYQEMCGGSLAPPSSTGTRFCNGNSLNVQVTSRATNMAASRTSPPHEMVAGVSTNCIPWTLNISPSVTTLDNTLTNQTTTYTITLVLGSGGSLSPIVNLSVGNYPNAISPGYPLFNPTTISASSTTSTLPITITSQTTPQVWPVEFLGTDQCGASSSNGPQTSLLTITGNAPTTVCSSSEVNFSTPNNSVAGTSKPIDITGNGFTNPSTVSFGSTPAASVSFIDSTHLNAATPVGLGVGTYNIIVTTAGCTSTLPNALVVTSVATSVPSASSTINACGPGSAGNYQVVIQISWSEPLFIPWFSDAVTLNSTQVVFCQ
jgi:hypothetical protein